MGRRFVNELKRISANDQFFVIGEVGQEDAGEGDGEAGGGDEQPGDDLGNS